jgi:predicted acyltransferase (DUF342 family)
VNPAVSVLVLLAPILGIGLLLSLPALLEWAWPKDSAPLTIDRAYAKQDGFFADRFRELAAEWWQRPDVLGQGWAHLAAGTILARPLLVPGLSTGPGVALAEEVWTRDSLVLGAGSRARALVSDGSIHLGPDVLVQRWIHGDGEVILEERCQAAARITSRSRILLAAGCRSQLISAPTIEWQTSSRPTELIIPTHARRWILRRRIPETDRDWEIARKNNGGSGTVFVNGDLIMDSESGVDYPLVVRGSLYIRHGVLIAGDIKAHGDLVVEGSAVVGNLCCGGRLMVGKGSSVQGCLRGDALVWLGDDVVVGRPERNEAVVGDRIILAGSGQVHGRMRALSGWIEVEA